jgi:hypothetical protein
MTQEAIRGDICLSEIDGLESVIARMPTVDECRYYGLSADAPVLIMRRRGREQLYAADMVRLTVDAGPPPAPDAAREAARYVVGHILEDLDHVRAKLADLADATEAPPQEIIRLADEYRRERAAGFS